MAFVGIDLGTTNSLVAQFDSVGRAQIIHNAEGSNLTPSVIYLEEGDNHPLVGAQAKSELSSRPENVAMEFKRLMGSNEEISLGGKLFSATELSALLLKKLRADYEAIVGKAETVVVTVPANFTNEAREATLAAIKAAGIETQYLLNEPTAAALYYAHTQGKKLNGNYIVYDLGGGTFDVTAIKVDGDDIQVLGSEGVARLGGKDFDQRITDLIAKKYEEKFSKKFDANEIGWGSDRAEEVKKSLSQVEEKKIRIVGSNIPPTTFVVTRAEFEQAISGLVAQTELQVESLLAEANLSIDEIQEVFLAGGSSRIPMVKSSLERLFGRPAVMLGNPDEAIALGAAIYAGFKAGKGRLNPLQKAAVGEMSFQEVAPHFFGTIILSNGQRVNDVLIAKNSNIPCEVTESYQTVHDGQTEIRCTITQSPQKESDPRFVRVIWEGDLELPPNRPSGQQINVTFAYRENGTMDATFLDVASQRKTQINIAAQNSSSKTRLNLDQFIVE
jgi:molecular chaperone DnaK